MRYIVEQGRNRIEGVVNRIRSWRERRQGPRLRTLTTMTELGDVLSELGVSRLTKSLRDDGSTSQIDWTLNMIGPISGMMPEDQIAPRKLVFGQNEDGQLTFECGILGEHFQVEEDGLVPTRENWSEDPDTRYRPAKALWLFLMAFMYRYTTLGPSSDFFGFQFFSTGDKGVTIPLRLGGVQFEFQLEVMTNQPLHGTLVVRRPI